MLSSLVPADFQSELAFSGTMGCLILSFCSLGDTHLHRCHGRWAFYWGPDFVTGIIQMERKEELEDTSCPGSREGKYGKSQRRKKWKFSWKMMRKQEAKVITRFINKNWT